MADDDMSNLLFELLVNKLPPSAGSEPEAVQWRFRHRSESGVLAGLDRAPTPLRGGWGVARFLQCFC